MLINASRLVGCPILSLHVGGRIAQVSRLIIDPDNLKIAAFEVEGPLVAQQDGNILPIESIREFSRLGLIVDSIDELVNPDDVIYLQNILKLHFSLVGLKVESKNGSKIGKVSNFTANPNSWQVHQLIVQRPLLKSFLDPELTIPRHQIISVDDYKVIIKDETSKSKTSAVRATDFTPNFINPFREPDFAPDLRTRPARTKPADQSDSDS